jgi:hypothetical protein
MHDYSRCSERKIESQLAYLERKEDRL